MQQQHVSDTARSHCGTHTACCCWCSTRRSVKVQSNSIDLDVSHENARKMRREHDHPPNRHCVSDRMAEHSRARPNSNSTLSCI